MNTLVFVLLGCVVVVSGYHTFPAAQPNPYCRYQGDYLLHPTDRCRYLRCEYLPVGDTGDYYQGNRQGYGNDNSGYGQSRQTRGNTYGQAGHGIAGSGGYGGNRQGDYGRGNFHRYGKLYAVEKTCAPGAAVPAATYPQKSRDDYSQYGCPSRISTAGANSICTEHIAEGEACPVKSPFDFGSRGYV